MLWRPVSAFTVQYSRLRHAHSPSRYVLLLALSAANVAGSTKRGITTGAVFIGYNVGNIIAPCANPLRPTDGAR